MTMSLLDPGQVLKSAYDDATGKLKIEGSISTSIPSGTLTDRSGTATTSSSQVCASNSNRHYFFIQNLSSTINIYINFTNAADTSTSILIMPNASFEMEDNFISTEAINVISASSTAVFSAKEG